MGYKLVKCMRCEVADVSLNEDEAWAHETVNALMFCDNCLREMDDETTYEDYPEMHWC